MYPVSVPAYITRFTWRMSGLRSGECLFKHSRQIKPHAAVRLHDEEKAVSLVQGPDQQADQRALALRD